MASKRIMKELEDLQKNSTTSCSAGMAPFKSFLSCCPSSHNLSPTSKLLRLYSKNYIYFYVHQVIEKEREREREREGKGFVPKRKKKYF